MKILVVILLLNATGDIQASRAVGAAANIQQCGAMGEAFTATLVERLGDLSPGMRIVTLCADISKGSQRTYGTEL